MSPQQTDVKEAQARLYELLSQIERFVPVARRVLLSSCVAGLHQGAIQTSPDSDKPLPEEFWTGEL
jgi:Flp pilus assembly CpaE family ATPase